MARTLEQYIAAEGNVARPGRYKVKAYKIAAHTRRYPAGAWMHTDMTQADGRLLEAAVTLLMVVQGRRQHRGRTAHSPDMRLLSMALSYIEALEPRAKR